MAVPQRAMRTLAKQCTMSETHQFDPDLIPTHTTAAASSVARWVARHHGIDVHKCHLIRRGLNDNYALLSAEGTRYVARIYSIRPRGAFNVDFEIALLKHLEARGAGVAAAVPTAEGHACIQLQFPEGLRALALFRHADGAIPDALEEFELTGRALAQIHEAARDYVGPESRYTLDGHHLAGRTLTYLEAYPELDSETLETYRRLVHRLLENLAEIEGGLTRVICHGDTHGFNNHVKADSAGTRKTVFFDFDDAGPGYLAYDLSVLPWSYMFRKGLNEPDDTLRERWTRYLEGYRANGSAVGERDLAALPLFLQLRSLWNFGEAVGRVHHWGTSSVPMDWLRKQVAVFDAWEKLDLRG